MTNEILMKYPMTKKHMPKPQPITKDTIQVEKADLNAVLTFLDSSVSKQAIKTFIIKYILKNERI
jgi:hypothetical protein